MIFTISTTSQYHLSLPATDKTFSSLNCSGAPMLAVVGLPLCLKLTLYGEPGWTVERNIRSTALSEWLILHRRSSVMTAAACELPLLSLLQRQVIRVNVASTSF